MMMNECQIWGFSILPFIEFWRVEDLKSERLLLNAKKLKEDLNFFVFANCGKLAKRDLISKYVLNLLLDTKMISKEHLELEMLINSDLGKWHIGETHVKMTKKARAIYAKKN